MDYIAMFMSKPPGMFWRSDYFVGQKGDSLNKLRALGERLVDERLENRGDWRYEVWIWDDSDAEDPVYKIKPSTRRARLHDLKMARAQANADRDWTASNRIDRAIARFKPRDNPQNAKYAERMRERMLDAGLTEDEADHYMREYPLREWREIAEWAEDSQRDSRRGREGF